MSEYKAPFRPLIWLGVALILWAVIGLACTPS